MFPAHSRPVARLRWSRNTRAPRRRRATAGQIRSRRRARRSRPARRLSSSARDPTHQLPTMRRCRGHRPSAAMMSPRWCRWELPLPSSTPGCRQGPADRCRDRGRRSTPSLSVAEIFHGDARIERRRGDPHRGARSFHARGGGFQVGIPGHGVLDEAGEFRIAEGANPIRHHRAAAMAATPPAGNLRSRAASVRMSAPVGGCLSAQPASVRHAAVPRRESNFHARSA